METATIRVMESSHNYNNHHVTIKQDENTLFDKYLMDFNNSKLSFKLEKLVENQEPDSISALDVYGYKGILTDVSIIEELEQFNNK